MEDKRGTKRTCSPSKEGSPVLSDAPTPPEVSLRSPHSPVFEQGNSSRKAPVLDLSLSSNEEGLIPDTSCDEEFIRRLFGDLNHDVLRLPGDGNVIILSNSDKEEEVREEDAADAEVAPSSATGIPTSTFSIADTDEAPTRVQDDNSGDRTPDWEADSGSNVRDEAGSP
jgi:hypothetical protein